MTQELTLGPVLFNWPAEVWRDFYFQIADESPVTTVFIGEVVCSKRAPLFTDHLADIVTRLEAAGKKVVFSTLAEVSNAIDRRLSRSIADSEGFMIEANDVSALWHLNDTPHHIGPYINVYNEESLGFFASKGAVSICLPVEMPQSGIKSLAPIAQKHDVALEVQVYGRMPLALSARCYHARAHRLTKDSCKFICDEDPDGLLLKTLDDKPFLIVNGVQTMSYHCLNLVHELEALSQSGVTRFRISPQSTDTVAVTQIFDAVLHNNLSPDDADKKLSKLGFDAPFSNGFFHQKPGTEWLISTGTKP